MSAPARNRRGHGEGSIHQREDGRWEGRLDLGIVDGRRKRVSVYGRIRRDVQKKLHERQNQLDSHGKVLDERLSVGAWLDQWVESVLPMRVTNGTFSESTLANYRDCVRLHLKPALGHIRLAKLSPQDVDTLIASKAREKYRPNSLRLIRATLHKALHDAQRKGLVVQNAASLSEPIRVPKRAQRWLSVEEAKSLLRQVQGDRLESLYILILSLGLRRGEALALKWEDIDLEAGTALIRRAVKRVSVPSDAGARTRLEIGATKTDASVRLQCLPQVCIDALRKHRSRQAREKLEAEHWQEHDLVFTTSKGTIIDPANFAKWLSKHCQEAGLGPRNPHQLRHSAATLLLAQQVPLHEVSEVLGHSSVSITKDVYGHMTTERRRAAADAMDNALSFDHSASKALVDGLLPTADGDR